jgi:hypothetical protein
MTISFPSIRCPTERSYKPGRFPIRSFVAQNGAVTKVARGDRITDAVLTLSYPYINNTEKALVVQLWLDALGDFLDVDLPSNAFDGDPELALKVPSYLVWYLEEPDIRTPQGYRPGLSSLTLTFNGVLEA